MKVAAIIFIVIGMFINFNISFALGIIGTVVGIIAIVTLASDKKSTAIGVLALIFTGLLGGVLYLCWNPKGVTVFARQSLKCC